MDITITINTDNAAFGDDPANELSRMLLQLSADWLHQRVPLEPGDEFNLRDINGNTVGKVTVT